MSETITAARIMEGMKGAFQPDKAAGVDVVVQYIMTGEGGGEYHMTIKNGTIEVQPGRAPAPKMTLTVDVKDYYDIVTGRLNAMAAFSSGKLRLGGDMMFAMKFATFFGRNI